MTTEEREAAIDHITSEYESYPATLANVLMDAACFQPTLDRFKKHRRSKNVRPSELENIQLSRKTLTIHVIGASEESELWGDFKLKHSTCKDVYSAYSEALLEMASSYSAISTIRLVFVGPNCPSKNSHEVRIIHPDKESSRPQNASSDQNEKKRKHEGSSCEVIMESFKSLYNKKTLSKIPVPDFVVFFNPGFTCPDYDWAQALDACRQIDTSRRIPFLVTTNTEMEAISELQYLHQHGYIDDLPAMVADIVEGASEHEADIADCNDNNVFFGESPNSGSRIRQSGNMANDLFCKNRWIYGGLFCGENCNDETSLQHQEKKKEKHDLATKKKKKTNAALM